MTATLTEVQLICVDCDASFSFTSGEQRFYAERGLPKPARCPECRAKRRAERNADAIKATETATGALAWMDNFGSYGGAAGGGKARAGRIPSRMYAATCSSCGKDTEVPFEPRGGRPVYCRDCFNARKGR